MKQSPGANKRLKKKKLLRRYHFVVTASDYQNRARVPRRGVNKVKVKCINAPLKQLTLVKGKNCLAACNGNLVADNSVNPFKRRGES